MDRVISEGWRMAGRPCSLQLHPGFLGGCSALDSKVQLAQLTQRTTHSTATVRARSRGNECKVVGSGSGQCAVWMECAYGRLRARSIGPSTYGNKVQVVTQFSYIHNPNPYNHVPPPTRRLTREPACNTTLTVVSSTAASARAARPRQPGEPESRPLTEEKV